MTENAYNFWEIVITTTLIVSSIYLGKYIGYNECLKEKQTDNIRYEIIIHPDKTITCEKK